MTTERAGARRLDEVGARRRRRKRVAAPLSRIAVAGLSASATFGLVAVMGAVARADTTADLDPANAGAGIARTSPLQPATAGAVPSTTRRQVIVVEHLPAEPTKTPTSAAATSPPLPPTEPATVAPGTAAPATATVPAPAPAAARAPVTKTRRS